MASRGFRCGRHVTRGIYLPFSFISLFMHHMRHAASPNGAPDSPTLLSVQPPQAIPGAGKQAAHPDKRVTGALPHRAPRKALKLKLTWARRLHRLGDRLESWTRAAQMQLGFSVPFSATDRNWYKGKLGASSGPGLRHRAVTAPNGKPTTHPHGTASPSHPPEMSQPPNEISDQITDVILEAKAARLAIAGRIGPHLDAIRGDADPVYRRVGEGAPRHPGRRQLISEAGTESSCVLVLDRGSADYLEAFPTKPPSVPGIIGTGNATGATLLDRLVALRQRPPPPQGKVSNESFFYPRGHIEALLTEGDVARVIADGRDLLSEADKPPLTDDQIRHYAKRICQAESGYHRVFAVLLLLNRGWEVVRFVDEGICDAELPLHTAFVNGPTAPPKLRRQSDTETDLACLRTWVPLDHEKFDQEQWAMVAPFFAHGGKRRGAKLYNLENKDILPWIEKQHAVRKGAYGEISKVKIHPRHHSFKVGGRRIDWFAVKHFNRAAHHGSHQADSRGNGTMSQLGPLGTSGGSTPEFGDEIESLNRFSGDAHPHLISLQAAVHHGDQYFVILPWAECDLKEMWAKEGPRDPLDKDSLV